MGIRQLGRGAFDQFEPARSAITEQVYEEREWYGVDAGNVLGIMVQHKADGDWGHVIFGRTEDGKYRAIEWERSRPSEDDARDRLCRRLEELEQSGRSVFPWGRDESGPGSG
jgi:hypothetical protein